MFNYLLPPHLLRQYCHHIFRRNFVSQSERNRNICDWVNCTGYGTTHQTVSTRDKTRFKYTDVEKLSTGMRMMNSSYSGLDQLK